MAALERGEKGAKVALSARASELMPAGNPAFLEVVRYPTIAQLIKAHGNEVMISAAFMLVKDFCGSVNAVRNMSEDQMIEAGAMLIDECGNFRMEDYLMMFTLAKRGQLVKILDRVDIQLIGQILDAYWLIRNAAGKKAQEDEMKAVDEAFRQPLILTPEMERAAKEVVEKMKDVPGGDGLTQEDRDAKEEIYRQEKIKQRQRDLLLRNQSNPNSDESASGVQPG